MINKMANNWKIAMTATFLWLLFGYSLICFVFLNKFLEAIGFFILGIILGILIWGLGKRLKKANTKTILITSLITKIPLVIILIVQTYLQSSIGKLGGSDKILNTWVSAVVYVPLGFLVVSLIFDLIIMARQ